MGRRRRRWREPGYVWWIGFVVAGAAAVLVHSWRVGLLTLLVWSLYELSLTPILCRITTREGLSCHEPVRGRAFACSAAHQQVKNEALWGAAGIRNPFRRAPAFDPNRDTGVVVYAPEVRGRLPENDRTILALAALGTVVSIIGAVVGLAH